MSSIPRLFKCQIRALPISPAPPVTRTRRLVRKPSTPYPSLCYHRNSVPLAPSLVRALPSSSRPLAALLERLRTPKPENAAAPAFALHETGAAARPYILAGIFKALG